MNLTYLAKTNIRAACAATLLIAAAHAAEPRLERIEPQGAQRGTEATIAFHGVRLDKPHQLLLYGDGIEVAELKEGDGKRFEAKLKLSETCPLGIHAVRLRTARGLSNLMTLHVGALPEIGEAEPNSEPTAAQAVPLGTVVNGTVAAEDVDYFAVDAVEGQRISVEVEGLRLGRTFFDPAVAILDEAGGELAACDDAELLRQDSCASIIAPKTGEYIVAVHESAGGGNAACGYRLHLGQFPRPAAVFPPGGRPGESLAVRWIGDARGERTETIVLPADGRETFEYFPADELGVAPSPIPMRVTDAANALEVEPNDERDQATPFTVPAACGGVIGAAGDADSFAFDAKKGDVLDVRVQARSLGSPLDAIVRVRSAEGKAIVGNDDERGAPDSYMRLTAPADGKYLLEIEDHLGRGGEAFVYRVEVTRPAAAVDVAIEEQRRYESQIVEVPQGNRAAVMVSAARRDASGPLRVEFGDLPPGVTAEALPMAAEDGRTAVLFTAAEDAAPHAALCSVAAISDAADKPVASRFRQQTWLVRGTNNRPVWNHFADRAAVAVIDPAPFRITLAEPAAPLVRGGSKELRVSVDRDKGFDDAVAVKMLYNPPGVSSNASITIPKGQSEAVVPFTAGASAALRGWRLIALGQANVNGRVSVASNYATLTVAEPFVGLTFATASAEQGSTLDYSAAIEVKTPFEGKANAELLGLPPGLTAEPVEFDAQASAVTFKVAVASSARVGRHKQIVCRVTIPVAGEPVVHGLSTSELRIDPAPVKEAGAETPAKGAS